MKKNKLLYYCLLIFALSICLLAVGFYRMEPDYLWHIKAGEYMFSHGIIKHDVFSWFLKGKYWMSHEWLFEIIIYFLKLIFGKFHTGVYCFICVFALGLILFFYNKNNLLKNVMFSLVWISLFIIISFTVHVRPHLISYCLLALTSFSLYDLYKNERSKKIYFLPFIEVIWSNVHGGSSNLVYLMCLLFLIVGLFKFKFNKIESKRLTTLQIKKYIIVMLLCIVAVCINIHGVKMLIYPYQNMFDSTMIKNILEWRETSLNELSHYIYYLFIIFIFGTMLLSKKKIDFMDLCLFGFCVFLGLKSIRFWFYTYIISSSYIYNYVGKSDVDNGTNIGIIALSILFCSLSMFRLKNVFFVKYESFLSSKDIAYIKKVNPKRLFNMYNYGGDLIYNNIEVFIDGRADLYSKYNYRDYLNISYLDGDYMSSIGNYDFDYFLVDKNYPINIYLLYNSSYELVYSNKDVIIYKKK